MKRGTQSNSKFRALSRRLGNARDYTVSGILVNLWALCARETPRGDIGRLANTRIADGIDWDGDPDDLIAALTETGWIDAHSVHRLVIHDWHEHAEDSIKKLLVRRKWTFADLDQTCPDMSRLPEPEPLPEPSPCPLPPAGGVGGGDRPDPEAKPDVPPSGMQPKRSSLRQQAADLWLAGGGGVVFRWCGDVSGEPYQRWLDSAEAWLAAGLTVDLAFLESVTAETWKRYQAKGSQGAKTLQWWLNTANDLAIKPPAPKPVARITLPQPPLGPSQEEQRARRRAYYERLATLPPDHPDVIEAEQSEAKRIAIARTRERLAGRLRSTTSGVGEFAGAA